MQSTAVAIGGTVQEATSGATGHLARFAFAPPLTLRASRRAAVALGGAELRLRNGQGAARFRFGDVDRPAVYRALAQLEKDGLVQSWSAESKAGQARRVYGLTEDGERALRTWMGVVKEERDALDRVLRRYLSSGTPEALLAEATAGWSAFDEHTVTTNGNGAAPAATPLAAVGGTGRLRAATQKHPPTGCAGCGVSPSRRTAPRCSSKRARRSGRSPSARSASSGWIETTVGDGALEPGEHTRAHLEIALERLASGNRLYDAELLRRIEARRHPLVTLGSRPCIRSVRPSASPSSARSSSTVCRRQLQGTVVASMPNRARSRYAGNTGSTFATSASPLRRC